MRIPWSRRGSPASRGRQWRLLLIPAMGIAVICQLSLTGTAGAATADRLDDSQDRRHGRVAPNPASELDCNGRSPKYATVRTIAATCTDPIKIVNGKRLRFNDNELTSATTSPASSSSRAPPGSGNTMTLPDEDAGGPAEVSDPIGQRHQLRSSSPCALVRPPDVRPELLPAEPVHPGQRHQLRSGQRPTTPGRSWNCSCTRRATPRSPTGELQPDQVVRGVTIDSLEGSFNFVTCNATCEEPVNFAYLQPNGVPAGPPSPQLSDVSIASPNGQHAEDQPG